MTDRKPPKPVRAWAVVRKDNTILPWSVGRSKSEAVQHMPGPWATYRKYGCRAIRVTIVPEPSDG